MIPAIKEIRGTEAYHGIIKGLTDLAGDEEFKVVLAARSKPIEDVRFQAGIAVGLRKAISALTKE